MEILLGLLIELISTTSELPIQSGLYILCLSQFLFIAYMFWILVARKNGSNNV